MLSSKNVATDIRGGSLSQPAIECRGISKQFDGITVLADFTASFEKGTVNVLAGENGAGKSTLFKILTGQITPDSGQVLVDGTDIPSLDPLHAQRLGISIIPQELMPIPDMSVYENLLLGKEIYGRFGMLHRHQMIDRARELLQRFELDINPTTPMRRLSIASTQLIEIIKATSRSANIVLMDEPTSAISSHETEQLFKAIQRLTARGVCILYTTHKMEEIEAIADNVTVLRDGVVIRHAPASQWTEKQIITSMVGREIHDMFPERRETPHSAPATLQVKDLRVDGYSATNSFNVKAGEIVGLGGLVGAGRSELLEAIFGFRKATGSISVNGHQIPLRNITRAIRAGLAMVPEDRKLAGVLTSMSILDNVTLPHLHGFLLGHFFLRNRARRQRAHDILTKTRVKFSQLTQEVSQLSGGNQQKVALARWLISGRPKVLLLDEPTRGIDVGARSELYKLIMDLAESGVAVLLASSDMSELLNLSDRVLVLRRGAIMGELSRDQIEQETVLRLAMGKTDD